MKTIKKVTALLLSMVLLLSFITAHAFAVDYPADRYYELHPSDDSISRPFHKYGVEMLSYAEAYATAYVVEDCDLRVKTYVTNQYINDSVTEQLFAIRAYVALEVTYNSGTTESTENCVPCAIGADSAVCYLYAGQAVEVEPDDWVDYFWSTHIILDGYRYRDPYDPSWNAQDDGTEIIHITTPYDFVP